METIQLTDKITAIHGDCMQYMDGLESKAFDLAVVDPPYGIGEDGKSNHSRGRMAKPTLYTAKNWDSATPGVPYFNEIERVAVNQIVWGGNHLIHEIMKPSAAWLVWDKENGNNDFADCELAYTSFKTAVRLFRFRWAGMLQGDMKNKEKRIHPTQKPVKLYNWIFHNYAKPTQRIIDTHGGSFSSAIAAHYFGCEFVIIEKDEEYFYNGVKRFKEQTQQLRLF